MTHISLVAQFGVTLQPGSDAAFQLLVRWIHFIAGITWIGLLYFFNLVNAPFMKSLEPEVRGKVFPGLMSRAMLWFRWSAVVTVAAGLFYWTYFIVMADARNARIHGFIATGKPTLFWFLLIWTAAFLIEFVVLRLPLDFLKGGPILGAIVLIVVAAAAWLFLLLNSHAWESSRLQSIGIGGGIGWFMMLNVWGVIWQIQKKLIRGATTPEEAARLGKQGLIISRINFVLSFPLLLFMAAASHFPFVVSA